MNKRVLVTGAAGFVGKHAIETLLRQGLEVHALDSGGLASLPGQVHLVQADLLDPKTLAGLPRQGWWGVVHLAGISVPSLFSTTAPVMANLQMTLNLLEALDDTRVLIVSSCHVYAPADQPRTEEDPLVPQGRYGLAKHLCEQVAGYYGNRLDVRIARPFNHLGSGMRPELLVPSLLRKLRQEGAHDGQPVIMRGRDSIRDFIDVRDVVEAYLAILRLEAPGATVFNVCTGTGTSIGDLVRSALELVGAKRPIEFEGHASSADDIGYLVGDRSRLSRLSGWAPRFGLVESLGSILSSETPNEGAP